MSCWLHKYSNWILLQENKCDGETLQARTCIKCNYQQKKVLIYSPIHEWSQWIETGTLKRHYYGNSNNVSTILSKVYTRTCKVCKISMKSFK